jgi:hypothetical protein
MPVNIQLSKISIAYNDQRNKQNLFGKSLKFMVGLGRVELPTSPLSGVRSSQLSYRPILRHPLVELVGIEPAAS